jgi:hypothetical protein
VKPPAWEGPDGLSRPVMLAAIERSDGSVLQFAQLQRPGEPPVLSIRHVRPRTDFHPRLAFKTHDELEALMRAVAKVIASRKAG